MNYHTICVELVELFKIKSILMFIKLLTPFYGIRLMIKIKNLIFRLITVSILLYYIRNNIYNILFTKYKVFL